MWSGSCETLRQTAKSEEGPRGRIAHVHVGTRTSLDPGPLTLVSTLEQGLSERLAGRVDDHLATFAEHMREGLLAASTAVGLEVMAELMDAEVTATAGPKGSAERPESWLRSASHSP